MSRRREIMLLASMLAGWGAPLQAQDRTVDLLRALSDAPGVPGAEGPVRKIMNREMTPFSDAPLRYDGLGSVIAVQGKSGPKVMLDAHMDELGGLVRTVDANGFISMQTLGGFVDEALFGQRWTIHGSKGPVIAVSGIRDAHLVPGAQRATVPNKKTLFLDVGAHSPAEVAALGIETGDQIVPDSKFQVMASGRTYVGKGFDDRVGCAILVEVMRRLKGKSLPNQIFYAATVQEEIGLRGAHTASKVIMPDVGIAIEGGAVSDTPDSEAGGANGKIGRGPQVFVYDVLALPNRDLVKLVKKVAADNKIPIQLELIEMYGEDSAEIQKTGTGVPTINITVPLRYTHAHNGTMERGDFDQTVDLIVALVQQLDKQTVAGLTDFSSR